MCATEPAFVLRTASVQPLQSIERLVCASFYDPSILQDNYSIGGHHSRQAVRNGDRCLIFQERSNVLVDHRFGFGIECRGELIQDSDT